MERNLYQSKEFSILSILICIFETKHLMVPELLVQWFKIHIQMLRIENSFDWYRFRSKSTYHFSELMLENSHRQSVALPVEVTTFLKVPSQCVPSGILFQQIPCSVVHIDLRQNAWLKQNQLIGVVEKIQIFRGNL